MNKRKHTDFATYLLANHYSGSTVADYVNALGRLCLDDSIQDALPIYENINSCLELYASNAPTRSYVCAKVAANRYFQMMVGQTMSEFSASRNSDILTDRVLAEFFLYSVNFKQMTEAAARSECLHIRPFI